MTHFAVLIPVAKQIAWACGIIAVLTPITRPGIDQRAAGISRIERGIGLNHIVHQPARGRAQVRPSAEMTPVVTRLRVSQRIADGDRHLAHAQLRRNRRIPRKGSAAGEPMRSTARSESGSLPTRSALKRARRSSAR